MQPLIVNKHRGIRNICAGRPVAVDPVIGIRKAERYPADHPPVVAELEMAPDQAGLTRQRRLRNGAEAKRLREYLLKGGFLMVDDFHGATDWEHFMNGMLMVFPDRPIEDLTDKDEIFHVLYDLTDRFQVPGEQYVWTGRTYEKDGYVPEWRAIKDDRGRVMVAICHNMHLGDAWEWADDPRYPEKFASLAFRLGINYAMYGMTH